MYTPIDQETAFSRDNGGTGRTFLSPSKREIERVSSLLPQKKKKEKSRLFLINTRLDSTHSKRRLSRRGNRARDVRGKKKEKLKKRKKKRIERNIETNKKKQKNYRPKKKERKKK